MEHLGLITILLEEQIPGLTVLGLSQEDLKPPKWDHRGECHLVRALLSHIEKDVDYENDDSINIKEIGGHKREELKRYVRKSDH